ncbi:MAG TPA: type II toxin-antitoxin system HicA family toxin [Hanamia sp.]
MRLPRDISPRVFIQLVKKFGYQVTRQSGSHIQLTTFLDGQHHITIPNHNPIRVGTLSTILLKIGIHFNKTKEEIADELF